MKAILVIEMPERCDDEQCSICYDSAMCSYLGRWFGKETERPADCPLKPLPQKKEETFAYWIGKGCNDAESYINGWNACLEEILGENK